MRWVALVILGGVLWMGLQGRAELSTFCAGGLLAAALAWLARLPWRGTLAPGRLARGALIVTRLTARFLLDVTVANVQQLRLVLSPRLQIRPRWIRFTTRLEHPATRTALGVLISMTPGTVTEDLQGEKLYIHVLNASSEDDTVARIRDRFERLLLDLEAL